MTLYRWRQPTGQERAQARKFPSDMTSATSSARWTLFTYAVLCAPLVLLLAAALRGAYVEVTGIRSAALQAETSRLRSQALRRVAHLRAGLEAAAAPGDWDAVSADPWLRTYWEGARELREHQVYAAIVDPLGNVVLHNDPALEGQTMGRRWYDYTVPEAGADIVHLRDSVLAPEASAYDIRIPLIIQGNELGAYHEGLDADWFDTSVAARQNEALESWGWRIALLAGVDLAAALALIIVTKRHLQLMALVREGGRVRATQLSQVSAGLAHEIRNPLHALRINLHSLRRAFDGQSRLTPDDIAASIQDSNNAIDGLDQLMRDLLRFTSADGGQRTQVNLSGELQATLNLLSEELNRREITVELKQSDRPLTVAMDPARLKQVLVNLLTFAQNNAGTKGRIDVSLSNGRQQVELVVADSGPTLADSDRSRIFEPFQATKETGSGLGLALVKTFVEEAGGHAMCEPLAPTGNRFSVRLPLC